uniref:Uncharacterized protein n=1 Tax=Panagrolaimus sp. JU765 TaxID=591449 RepID=A0AC34RMY1_9BILA
MSMNEILKFIEEYQNGDHKEYERLLYYALKKISVNSGISENFLNDTRFDRLSYLIFEAYWHKKFLETEILPLKFPSNQLVKMMNGSKIDEKTKKQIIVMNKSDFYNLNWEAVLLFKMDILLSNDVLQSFVKTQDSNERVLIGFGFHQNRTKPNKTEGSEIFVSPCPLECTIDDRQWICINCGEFFRADGLQMICSCGRTHVANLKFECFDSNHPKEFFDDGTF